MSGWRKRGGGQKPEIIDEDYEDEICSACSGSGEGMYDGSTCYKCKGSGVEPVEIEEDV
jgi:DnaJ-class molecular chaperone